MLTSQLTARVRDQAEAARRREARTAALYAFSRQIAGAVGLDDLLPVVVAARRASSSARQAVVLLPGRRAARGPRARIPPDVELGEAERAAATWVWEHDAAGRAAAPTRCPGGEWLHVPLAHRARRGRRARRSARAEPTAALPLDQRQLLEALAGQAAVAIERTRIDVVLEEKAKTEAVIESDRGRPHRARPGRRRRRT